MCRGWLKDKAVKALWNLHLKGLKQLLKSKKKVDVFPAAFVCGPYSPLHCLQLCILKSSFSLR